MEYSQDNQPNFSSKLMAWIGGWNEVVLIYKRSKKLIKCVDFVRIPTLISQLLKDIFEDDWDKFNRNDIK